MSLFCKVEIHIANILRKVYLNKQKRRLSCNVKDADKITIISSNCNGGVVCSDLGLRFNSPFVNLFILPKDYIKILSDLRLYMNSDLIFVKEYDENFGQIEYPTAYLLDAKIYFMHYKNEEDAREAWYRRRNRMNWENLWIVFSDRDGCTIDDLKKFDELPYEHKVVFTHKAYPEIKSAFYIKGYEKQGQVGILTDMQYRFFSAKRIIEQFDFVNWFASNQ